MSKSQDKWDALSEASKAKRQLIGAVVCGLVVVYGPMLIPLDNIANIVCATIVMFLGLMLAFGGGMHAGPFRR